jgi:hypothetical protein
MPEVSVSSWLMRFSAARAASSAFTCSAITVLTRSAWA